MPRIFVLNGPNLNLLGVREPEVYGSETLADVEAGLGETARELGLEVTFRQTNHEGQLIDWVHEARQHADAVIINPAGLTHTSIALMDALKACACPIVEVHLSNVHRRESFRHLSYVSLAATAVMAGFGTHGYALALRHVARLLEDALRAH